MIDTFTAQLALRSRATTLVVATTGSTTLSATATGFARTAGSFITDGFVQGMEILPSGFFVNTRAVITNVTALALTIDGTRSAEGPTSGRTLVAGLPETRAFENRETKPIAGKPYIEESFQSATMTLRSFPAQGGSLEETGLYVITWYGVPNQDVGAIRKSVDALKALFAPGTEIMVGTGVIRVRSDFGPSSGQLVRTESGHMACQLIIPWRAESTNTVAA
jgi:hypothetical protein